MRAEVQDILEKASDSDLATSIMRSYVELEEAVALSQWKLAGVSAGHFVEAVRRFLELKLFGTYTPIAKSLSGFSTQLLAKLEAASGEECYRFHIPRALFGLYGMRNKKGYGHLSLELANRIDVEFMLNCCRWVLAEIVRVNSTHSIEETDTLVSQISERRTPAIWKTTTAERVLKYDLGLRDSVLLLLLHRRTMSFSQLEKATEAKAAYLKRTLKELHSKRMIEFDAASLSCQISPTGSSLAEDVLEKVQSK